MTVKVVTDSTSDLTLEEAAELGVTIVPLTVHFGTQTLLDGVEIGPREFFHRLATEQVLPKTSQPPAGAFAETYRRLLREGASAVVSVHISSKLSGTINSARTARESLEHPPAVKIVDSGTVSAALAYGARAAGAAAAAGAGPDEVVGAAEDAIKRTRLLVVLDTLEYLQKGGRIGRARAWFGSVLNIKPVLAVADGEVVPVERVRTHARAIARLVELTITQQTTCDVTVLHSGPEEEVARICGRITAALPNVKIRTGWLGPVVGVYTGPNAIGTVTLDQDGPQP